MVKLIIFLLTFRCLSFSYGLQGEECYKRMKDAGASDTFGTMVGHLLHSYTLDRLKELDPSVTIDNRVPMTNYDVTSTHDVLPSTPDIKGPNDANFQYSGTKILDFILWQNSNNKWVGSGLSTLTRLIHQFHMEELMGLFKYF